jgi:RNA polymerase sigma-70 factor (ECF subfamily)
MFIQGPDKREERLNQLVTLYERDLLRMCFVYLRDAALAEDAVQETFLKAYKALPSFREEASEKTWLMRIAINTCKDMRRGGWFRYVNRNVSLDSLPAPLQDPTGEDNLLTLEIMRLPRKQMEVILLYYYQHMTVYDIGQLLGITATSVSQRLKKARQQLRNALEGEQNG